MMHEVCSEADYANRTTTE